MFFPVGREEKAARHAAREYCDRCPVHVECLAYALHTASEGVWAGTTTNLRKRIRRKRSRKVCPQCGARGVVRAPGFQVCVACAISWPIPEEDGVGTGLVRFRDRPGPGTGRT